MILRRNVLISQHTECSCRHGRTRSSCSCERVWFSLPGSVRMTRSGGGCSTMPLHILCSSKKLVVSHYNVCGMQCPMVIAGTANVWHPHFNLSRSRSCDVPIILFSGFMAFKLELCPGWFTHIWIASLSSPVILWTLRCTMGCNVAQVPLCCQCWEATNFLHIASCLFLSFLFRPSAWTNVAAFAPLETHFDPCAVRKVPSVECASPRSLAVQLTLQGTAVGWCVQKRQTCIVMRRLNDVTANSVTK